MTYKLIHKTKYDYSAKVNKYNGLACIQPLNNQSQKCNAFDINIQPEPTEMSSRVDFFGNTLHYFTIDTPHKELIVEAKSRVESYFRDLN